MSLRRFSPDALPERAPFAIPPEINTAALELVDDVRARGEPALREHAERLGDLGVGEPLVLDRATLRQDLAALDADTRALLERVAGRIESFARAQRSALAPVDVEVPGGRAGHRLAPVERAGCYAPGGRFPLPSSVLMTAVTAKAAGVREVWVASPRPGPVTRAAAALAGAEGLLCAGGAPAIAALAFGAAGVPACDVLCGPGGAWVTAAKAAVSGEVAVDMVAGPSELVVLADARADPELVAADLLAQAEHDPLASPVLVTPSRRLADAVDQALEAQLADLPTAEVAREALANGYVVEVADLDQGVDVCNALAPEHLELLVDAPGLLEPRLLHYGGLFEGAGAAEVLGDYGIGPNHVLPTAGAARARGGLSVFDFLRVRTWLRIDRPEQAGEAVEDAVQLARLEGLEAHARSAAARRTVSRATPGR